MHCQSHWWVRSWYPKLRLCCPAAWPRQSSAAGGGVTEALRSSPEDGAPTHEGRSEHLAQMLWLSQLPPGQNDGYPQPDLKQHFGMNSINILYLI